MSVERNLLEEVKALFVSGQYRIRIHAVRHMIEEGFGEQDLLEAVTSKSRILENYSDESRCLILGYFRMGEKSRCPLHVVCDYSGSMVVDVVTAYIPQKPWWVTASRRGKVR